MVKKELLRTEGVSVNRRDLYVGGVEDERVLESIYEFWMRQDTESVEMRFNCSRVPLDREYRRMLENSLVVCLEFDSEGQLVGYAEACISDVDNQRVELAVAVDGAHRRKGIAKAMIMEVVGECMVMGIRELEAEVNPQNRKMLQLISKMKKELPLTTKYEEGMFRVKMELA